MGRATSCWKRWTGTRRSWSRSSMGERGDVRWGTIPRLVDDAASRFGDRVAVVDGDVRMTFEELARRLRQAGSAVAARGIERDDRVAIWAPNVWVWIGAG